VRALQWQGVNKVAVGDVPDPEIRNAGDIVVRVNRTVTCGSDLHLLGGYIPFMEKGDVLGHEFLGEVVEVGPDVRRHHVGDRVVVSSFIACGSCWYCDQKLFSLCDNTHPKPELQVPMFGYPTAGIYGYTHAFGGYAGSHAEYVRVPFADNDCFHAPEGVPDEQLLFLSDAAPTGYMGADFCDIRPGDTIAVWGCGGVGLMAQRSAYLLGAERVIVIDRFDYRLEMAEREIGAEALSDLALVLSELTTNAVTFGPGFDIHISVAVDSEGGVRGEVDDGGFRGVAVGDVDPVAARGLGLLIVDALTEDWGVEPGTTRVWFDLSPGSGHDVAAVGAREPGRHKNKG